MKTRYKYVDYLKAIGIFLVILGHINFANASIKEAIYSFHMPLFFFASGLVLKDKKVNGEFLLSKTKRLFIPYIIWGLLYGGFSFMKVALLAYGSYYSINAAGSLSSLWFLIVSFVSVILSQLLVNRIASQFTKFLISAAAFVIFLFIPSFDKGYPWCLNICLIAISFIMIGNIVGSVWGEKKHPVSICIILIAVGAVLLCTYRMNPIAKQSYVLMADGTIGNPIFFLTAALGGCMSIYGISKMLEVINVPDKFISFIGQNTLTILLVHKPLISLCETVFSKIGLPSIIELFIVAIIVLMISCLISVVINFFVPQIVGKKT